jgi:hypothetical protein
MTTVSCTDVASLLPPFALDAVDDDDRELVREHLNGCLPCSLECEALRASASVIDDGQPAPSPALWPRILDTIRARRPEAPPVDDGAAAIRPDGSAPVRTRPTQRLAATASDVDLLRLTSQTAHDLLWIQTPQEAGAILTRLVRALGADVVGSDQLHDPDCIPIDISFGVGEPTFPASPRLSVARMMVEEVLPVVVEDARRAIALARERQRRNVQ